MELKQDETTPMEVEEKTDDLEILKNYIEETKIRLQNKIDIRNGNLNCEVLPDSHFSKLDSSLKKNTTFVKKLKTFSANQLDSLLKDLSGLNLTKYISEVAAALVEAKLKMTDIPAIIKLCSTLHQNYPEFSQSFFENWQKNLTIKPNEKVTNPSKLRVDIRLYAELINAGIFTNKNCLPLLGTVLTTLINNDKEEHNNIATILSFCKHCGEDYAGLVPTKIRQLAEKYNMEVPKPNILPPEKQNNVRTILREYYTSITKHLTTEHINLQALERANRRTLQTKGELSADRKDKTDALQASYEKLLAATGQFSELLDLPMPELPVEKIVPESEGGVMEGIVEAVTSPMDPWEDDETKAFYEDLPDLRQYLPNYCAKEKSEDISTISPEVLDSDNPDLLLNEDTQITETIETEIEENTPSNTKQMLEAFLSNLCNCVNKEMIDSAAIDFLLNLNTKHGRKKLAKNLFGVSRTRLDLLPFYARLAATVSLVNADVGNDLAQMLKQDFKYHVRKKDQINIESKIKVVRYIGELVKFQLYSKMEALFCLKILLLDFQHHHIEMACAFLEVCGKYLYNHMESRQRTLIYLEQIMRIKTVSVLDSRHVAQIESVYYLVRPPDSTNVIQKVRLPIHQYIRNLIYQDLCKMNIDKILKLLRKIDWNDKNIANYAIKCLTNAYNVRYHLIRCLADLLAGLSSHQEKAVYKVVDGVFEDIRNSLENYTPKFAQRRIAMAKYLGELYNYRLIESADILKTLYAIISLGVTMSYNIVSEVDPPASLFRLKLACVLLETCAQYFTSSLSRKRMDYFLIFFQNYYWFKKNDPIWETEKYPLLFDHEYKDSLQSIGRKITIYNSFEECQEAIDNLKKMLYPNLGEESNENDVTDSLNTIEEETEGEEVDETDGDVVNSHEDSEMDLKNNDDEELTEEFSEQEGISSTEDVKVKLLNTTPRDTEEDQLFQQALDKMMAENCQERLKDTAKMRRDDIVVPMIARNNKKNYDQIQDVGSNETSKEVPFVLMLRKGTKQQYKSFSAPVDSQLAINLKSKEQEIKEEKERVKRLTLNITERLEEEDYQEMLAANSRQNTTTHHNSNRDRAKGIGRFKHQKGAPDADLIFGTK
ncbi:regulator of nonsense transcripts 2-like [Ctenocephalides felis]|uniref:regulator of nonsense transcripts 2-like n=1 Tax=Ctenocephalides felis TaxID=7515 RepID=UPI000E6E416C|nr:regulator of nonsense transcripts 2-like [Ctenocephalides felis]